MSMRAFTAAAVQLAPVPGPITSASIKSNVDRCVSIVERCVAESGAELVVLPETASTGFTPALSPEQLFELVDAVPGAVTAPIQEVAARLKVHVVLGTYERGTPAGTVYNTAALIGPSGDVLGAYRKTHLFAGESASGGGHRHASKRDEQIAADCDQHEREDEAEQEVAKSAHYL